MTESIQGLLHLVSFSPMLSMREVFPPPNGSGRYTRDLLYTVLIFRGEFTLRYTELLKQIPPGKEELPEVLLKKLDSAAFSLINNQAGQYDLTNEEREAFNADDFPDISDRHGKWGLLDRWPLQLGDLIIYKGDEPGRWYLEINSGGSSNLVLESGSKQEMLKEMESLNEYREAEGEEAFEAEIMRLVDHYQRVRYDRYGEY